MNELLLHVMSLPGNSELTLIELAKAAGQPREDVRLGLLSMLESGVVVERSGSYNKIKYGVAVIQGLLAGPRTSPMAATKLLTGYDATMRRHAANCEGGR